VKVFFDTSAIAKRYTDESGQDRVESHCRMASQIGVCVICLPEVISMLCRLEREGRLDLVQYELVKTLLFQDFADMDICDITSAVLENTVYILETNTLRGMDALHIACAMVWETDVFISSDLRQIIAAKKMGLSVVEV
jgi:uncharacterized protein